jgi:hypothetical protein
MKVETRKCHILNFYGRVQDAENEPESSFVLRYNAGVASAFEELTQSLVSKTANHEN